MILGLGAAVLACVIGGAAIMLTRTRLLQPLSRIGAFRHDQTVLSFAVQVVRVVVIIIGMIAVLQRLGVQTTSIIAVLGAASLAIGLALQGALSNVAAGVLMLILRPYRVGDQVEIAGQTGTVKRLDLFTTDLATRDNRKVVVPNAKAMSDVLVNRSAYKRRRIELDFDVDYKSELDHVFAVMRQVAEADPRVQDDPAPWAGVTQLKDWSMLVSLYAWVETPDEFQARHDLRQAVKEAFDREGVEIPFPTQVAVPGAADAPETPKPNGRRAAATRQ